MRFVLSTVLLGAFFVGFGSIKTAEAADESAAGTSYLEEVVVTARRREETAQDVPIPISALSSDQLRERGITEIKNIEQVTPNMSFLNSGVNKGTAQIFMRGIGQVNWGPTQDPKVGTYVDGVYLGRPQGGVFDLFDIERVEVLRGPQGTLFGRNTTAGLVQVITKDPTDDFEFTVQAGIGNDEQMNTDVVLNIPIIEGVLSGRLAMQTRRDDGYMKDNIGRDWHQTDSQSARGKLLWTPTDDLRVLIAGELFFSDETASLGQCVGGVPGGGTGLNFFTDVLGRLDDLAAACTENDDWYRSNDNDPNGSKVTTRGITVSVDWDLESVTLSSLTAWRTIDELNESWGWATDFAGDFTNSLEVLGDQNSPYEQYSQEFRISGLSMNDRLSWTGGIYGFRESATGRLNVPFWPGLELFDPDPADAPLFYVPGEAFGPPFSFFPRVGDFAQVTAVAISRRQETHATNKSWAVFAEGTYDITEKLGVTLGWRWTKDTREFKRYQFTSDFQFDPGNTCPGNPIDPVTGSVLNSSCTQSLTYNESTPRIIFNYDLTDDVMLYAGFSRGYSSGGMNGDIRMRPFQPEISDNWEAGFKGKFLDGRLQLNMTAFRTDYENQQITVSRLINGQPTADLINAQEAEIEGIEMDMQWSPMQDLYITASAGVIQGDYKEFSTVDEEFDPITLESTVFINDFSETEFIGGAPYTYSLNVAKVFNMDNGSAITASSGWSYRGRTYNTLRRFKSSRQGKYGILDARIVWDMANGKTTVALWGTNLGDREYYRAALDLPNGVDADGNTVGPDGQPVGSDLGTTTLYPSEPRRYGLTVTHRFGESG